MVLTTRACFKIVLPFPHSHTVKSISMAEIVSPYQHSWLELTMSVQIPEKRHSHSSIRSGKCLYARFPGSWPAASLGNSPSLRVEDGLAGAWQQYHSREKTVLLLSVQCLALLLSLEVPACLITLSSSSSTVSRAAWGSCTLPSQTWTCSHGGCLPVSSVGALFACRNGLACHSFGFS